MEPTDDLLQLDVWLAEFMGWKVIHFYPGWDCGGYTYPLCVVDGADVRVYEDGFSDGQQWQPTRCADQAVECATHFGHGLDATWLGGGAWCITVYNSDSKHVEQADTFALALCRAIRAAVEGAQTQEPHP